MLLGEHLGRREQHGLAAGVDDGEHGAQRDQRLAGADLALQQPVHRVLGGQVGEDLGADLLLTVRQGEGQPGVEGVQHAAGDGAARDRGQRGVGGPALGEGDLEDERLVPAQPVLGALLLLLVARAVDQLQRLGQRDQVVLGAQLGGQRLADLAQVLGEGQLDAERELPAGQLGAGRVHRDEPAGELLGRRGALLLVDQLVVGRGELPGAVEQADLAREQALLAGLELLLPPALVEEHQGEPGAAVGDHHFQPVALAAAERDQRDLLDPGQHGDVLVHLQLVQAGELAALDVPARVVVQQVADRAQLEGVGQHLRGAVADQVLQWFIESAHRIPFHTTGRTFRLTRPRSAAARPPGRPGRRRCRPRDGCAWRARSAGRRARRGRPRRAPG